ncbi:MAG: hypothetical protein ACXW0T_08850 [Methylobacter sp.]
MSNRTITVEIVLPEWAHFMVIEESGTRWIYEYAPYYDKELNCFVSDGCSGEYELYHGKPVENWKESLVRL